MLKHLEEEEKDRLQHVFRCTLYTFIGSSNMRWKDISVFRLCSVQACTKQAKLCFAGHSKIVRSFGGITPRHLSSGAKQRMS